MVVHSNKLRWLMWLRLRLFFRGIRRTRAGVVVLLLLLFFLLFIGVGVSNVIFTLFHESVTVVKAEGMYVVFTGLLLAWIVLPLLSFSTNKGLDVSKLQLFPLTRLEVMASLLFSSLFGWGTFFLVLMIGSVSAAWWLVSPGLGLMTMLVSLVFYLVMVSISQMIIALLMRTLQSRRFRDLSMIIIALFSSSYVLFRLLALKFSSLLNFGYAMQHQRFSPYLQWLPSGVAASSVRYAAQGNWGAAFTMFGLLLIICGVVLYLWNLLLERSMTASESGVERLRRAKMGVTIASPAVITTLDHKRKATTRSMAGKEQVISRPAITAQTKKTANAGRLFIFDQLLALMQKELRYFWREPRLKARLFQRVISMLILLLLPVLNAKNGSAGNFMLSYLPFASVIVVFLLMLMFSQNILGMEQQSLYTLLLFPIDRRLLLWGKNLALLTLGLVALIVLLSMCAVEGQRVLLLPAGIIGLAGLGVTLGTGNITSTFFPRYQPKLGQRGITAVNSGQVQSGGCLNALMALVMTVTTVVMLVPVALGIALPFIVHAMWIWLATIPFSLAYSTELYIVLTNLAAKRLLATEPEILKLTTRE